jgi:hypothetical protein
MIFSFLHDGGMQDDANDEDDLQSDAWLPLSTANTRILSKIFPVALSEAVGAASPSTPAAEQKEKRSDDGETGRKAKHDGSDHERYVAQRLRETALFEQRARGIGIKRLRRQ